MGRTFELLDGFAPTAGGEAADELLEVDLAVSAHVKCVREACGAITSSSCNTLVHSYTVLVQLQQATTAWESPQWLTTREEYLRPHRTGTEV